MKKIKKILKKQKNVMKNSNVWSNAHFLKTYNKKIYVHNDNEYDDGLGLWWVEYKKQEFHINPPEVKP